MDWLQTNHGAEVGPKVWSTLLNIHGEVNKILAGTGFKSLENSSGYVRDI